MLDSKSKLIGLLLSLWVLCYSSVILVLRRFGRKKPPSRKPGTVPARGLDWYAELLAKSPTQTVALKNTAGSSWRGFTVVTANPENVEYILRTNFRNYPKGPIFKEILGDLLGRGIFNSDGELWWMQHRVFSHAFPGTGGAFRGRAFCSASTATDRFLARLADAADAGRSVDLQYELQCLALDNICALSFRKRTGTEGEEQDGSAAVFSEAFDVAAELSARRTADSFWKLKRMLNVGTERRLADAIGVVRGFARGLVRSSDSDGADVVSRFGGEVGEDEEFLVDVAVNLMLAGRDTTASALTWFFWLVATHPHVETRLLEEIQRCLPANLEPRSKNKYVDDSNFALAVKDGAEDRILGRSKKVHNVAGADDGFSKRSRKKRNSCTSGCKTVLTKSESRFVPTFPRNDSQWSADGCRCDAGSRRGADEGISRQSKKKRMNCCSSSSRSNLPTKFASRSEFNLARNDSQSIADGSGSGSAFGGLQYEAVAKMEYLHVALCEAMRLYPPVPFGSKYAAADDVLPDKTVVRCGDRITVHAFAMGRMPSIWGADCAEFRPERWLAGADGAGCKVSAFEYPVFHAGARACIGREVALLVMKCAAAAVLSGFRVRPAPDAPARPAVVHCLTARMHGGFPVTVSRRRGSAGRSNYT